MALAQAQLGTQDAAMSLGDAQTNLTNITNQSVPGTQQYNDLQKQLRDAQTALQDATTSQMNAQDKLNSVINEGIPGTVEYNTLQRELRDATENVNQAALRQTDAQQTLTDVMVGTKSLSNELADKQHSVDVASRSVNDALWSQAQAADAVTKALDAQTQATDNLALAQAQLSSNNNVFATNTNAQPGGSAFYANYPTGHAAGGSFSAGEWMTVGENGPEVVRFGQSGTVIPNHDLGGGAGGGGINVTIQQLTVTGVQDVNSLYEAIRSIALQEAQGMGAIYGGRA
jgi:predicted  nucleic acid-binding Zn-ribbon protein